MILELLGMLGSIMFAQICGRRTEQPIHIKQLAHHQALGHRREHLEGNVKALFDRIDHAVIDHHIELDLGIHSGELRQHRTQMIDREPLQNLYA
ncbi:hypothetical protein D3C87_1447130 [compost metagenome]